MDLSILRVLFSPVRMIMVPPRHYCVVINPVARGDDQQVRFDQSGQAKLRHADLEIRLTQDPFPLYPGEEVQQVGTGPAPFVQTFIVHHLRTGMSVVFYVLMFLFDPFGKYLYILFFRSRCSY